MQQKRFKEKLKEKSGFLVIVELTSGPDFSLVPIEKFLEAYQSRKTDFQFEGFDFVAITSTDNSGGTPNIEPLNVFSHLKSKGLLDDLDFIPHISCKDKNSDALISSLAGFKVSELETLLVVTGDKPDKG